VAPGRGRRRASASAVPLVVAGVGPGADLAPGELYRRLFLVWRQGLVPAAASGRAGGATLAITGAKDGGSGGYAAAKIWSDLDLSGPRSTVSAKMATDGTSVGRQW
jgi:hypothetical protein